MTTISIRAISIILTMGFLHTGSLAFVPVVVIPAHSTTKLFPSATADRSLPLVAMTMTNKPTQEVRQHTVAEKRKKLGIDIGKQMEFLSTEQEKEELKAELTRIIDDAVDAGITDLEKLHQKWQRDLEDGKSLANVQKAMRTNGKLASYKFNRKVDQLVDTFFSQTLESRKRTHELATEDEERIRAQEREKAREKRQAEAAKTNPPESWSKTNDAWDKEWDDW